MALMLSLFSPIAELFPNLYMSWWAPSNGNLKAYLKASPRRVAVVLTVWLPIIYTLGFITSTLIQLFIGGLVFAAFGLRLYFFDNALKQSERPDEMPTDISSLPEFIYFIAFSSIGWVLYHAVSDQHWLVPVGILSIFLGAGTMSRFRQGANKNLTIDIIGRIVFTFGFLMNLYNIAKAADLLG